MSALQIPSNIGRVKVTFRNMKMTDLTAVSNINKRSLTENYSSVLWMNFFEKGKETSYVAVYAGQVVGYILAFKNNKIAGADCLYIASFAVDDLFRKRGIGAELINRVINHKMDISLHVRVSNQAVKFYKHHNFTEISTVPSYYKQPEEDAYELFLLRVTEPLPVTNYLMCVV